MPAGRALLLAALLGVAAPASAAPPRVKVEYSPRQDRLCSLLPGSSIKDEWKAELLSRQAQFLQLWEREGPGLLAAAEKISGKTFPSRDVVARLTLCNSPSESFPQADRVTLNMRHALASFTPRPVSLRYKAHTLFHELLHIHLFRHPMESSPLLQLHAAEHERVRGHLHLLALPQAASAEMKKLAQEGKCWDAAEKEFKLAGYESWPGYANGLPFIARRYCGLWGRGT